MAMHGEYRDAVIAAAGRRPHWTRWRPNSIVESCWPLIAGLLGNEEGLRGILYLAVGEGDARWDDAPATRGPLARHLREEVVRVPIAPEDITYLGEGDEPSREPTPRLEIRVRLAWETPQVLREFGVFGGDATEAANSGRMINHVVHDRLNLGEGSTLTRQIRFSFGQGGLGHWLDPAEHWLGQEDARLVDGVGDAMASALRGQGILTVNELAVCEPLNDRGPIPLIPLVELRSKARLALRTAAEIRVSDGFLRLTAWEVLLTPTATLALNAHADVTEAAWLREKIGALEVALNHHFLSRVTVRELVGHRRAGE
ncbi:MAG: hypothetical protein EA350_03840 [Gemmatimonadales bacterium]|nr:MAG: hypothetical protein EA350_03840 [Gemmatimonadales bacterium]